jgi:hypothetical protein
MKQNGHVCSLLRPLNLRSQKVKISLMSLRKRRRTIGRIYFGGSLRDLIFCDLYFFKGKSAATRIRYQGGLFSEKSLIAKN